MCRSTAVNGPNSGFTLIEVLVALSILAITLSSIGALIASSVRGTRSIEGRLLRLEAARDILTALPDRDQLAPGRLSGEISSIPWQVDVSPLVMRNDRKKPTTHWVPQSVVVRVKSPTGDEIQVSTVRLQWRNDE